MLIVVMVCGQLWHSKIPACLKQASTIRIETFSQLTILDCAQMH